MWFKDFHNRIFKGMIIFSFPDIYDLMTLFLEAGRVDRASSHVMQSQFRTAIIAPELPMQSQVRAVSRGHIFACRIQRMQIFLYIFKNSRITRAYVNITVRYYLWFFNIRASHWRILGVWTPNFNLPPPPPPIFFATEHFFVRYVS